MSLYWYRTGTVSVTTGSDSVTGVGAYFATASNKPLAGDIFTRDNQTIYEILSVVDDDTIQLDRTYEGTTATGVSYAIIRNTSATTNTRLAAQVSETLDLLGSRVTVSTAAPAAGQGRDGDIWIVATGA